MTFDPLITATAPIPLHAYAAIAALFIGALQLVLPKGGLKHRILGFIWVALMVLIALTSFFIQELRLIGPFSPIHLLSILVLYSLFRGVMHARAGRIRHHRTYMRALYLYALILTGLFTLLPGRVMHQVFFG